MRLRERPPLVESLLATASTPPMTTSGIAGATTGTVLRAKALKIAPNARATTIDARRRRSPLTVPSALSSLKRPVSVPVT